MMQESLERKGSGLDAQPPRDVHPSVSKLLAFRCLENSLDRVTLGFVRQAKQRFRGSYEITREMDKHMRLYILQNLYQLLSGNIFELKHVKRITKPKT